MLIRKSIIVNLVFIFLFNNLSYGQLTAEIEHSNAPNYNNGYIYLIVDDGIAPYEFLWDNGEEGNPIDELSSGTYCVTVTDAICCTATGCFTVSSCPEIIIGNQTVLPSGPLMSDGSIAVTSAGGTPPYTYQWNVGFSGDNLTGISPGYYCVLATDFNRCETSRCFDIGYECIDLMLSATPSCVCSGGTGFIELVVEGGSGNYAFQWAGDVPPTDPTEQNVTVLESGSYSVKVSDLTTGCEAFETINVEKCDFDVANFITEIKHDCDGSGSGSISIQIPLGSGSAPYYFIWFRADDPSTQTVQYSLDGNNILENINEGEYCVRIMTENNTCITETCDMVVKEYETPEVNYVITPETSLGADDGAITLNVLPASGYYTYDWGNGTTTDNYINNITSGEYCVTISYETGCTTEECITVHDCATVGASFNPTAIVYSSSPQNAQPYIDLTVTNLEGYEFNYIWSNGEEEQDIFDLAPNTYCVTISSGSDNCSLTSLGCWPVCSFYVGIDQIDMCDGELLFASGPSGANYVWDNGDNGSSSFSPYGENHCVTVTFNGCHTVACVFSEQEQMSITPTIVSSTYGQNNGSISLSIGLGTPSYTYEWDHDPTENDNFAENLDPGEYCVTVTDGCGSTATQCMVVECEFGPQHFNAQITPYSCSAGTTGVIDLTPVAPLPPGATFSYIWNNGETTEDISNLSPGLYQVTISEQITGCWAVLDFEVPLNGALGFKADVIVDYGCGPGTIQATATTNGGQPPYAYEWRKITNPQIIGQTQTISNLANGFYFVKITDSFGCFNYAYAFISAKPDFYPEVVVEPNSICKGHTAQVTGVDIIPYPGGSVGTPPYTYTWANQNSPLATFNEIPENMVGLEAGSNWLVTVTDAFGCTGSNWFSIGEYSIEIDVDKEPDPCGGGSIYLTVSNGAAPYSYLWNNGATSANLLNVPSDKYNVTVTDNNGCTASRFIPFGGNPPPNIEFAIVHPISNNEPMGSITTSVQGGAPPFTYVWSNGSNSPNLTDLSEGQYSLTVTNSEGCTAQKTAYLYINQPPVVILNPFTGITPCFISNGIVLTEGTIDIEVSGGCTSSFFYNWTGPAGFSGATTQDLSGIDIPGEYCVTVLDACNNTSTECATVVCSCSAELTPTVEMKISNPCLNGGWLSINDDGTADIEIGSISNPLSGDPATFFIEFFGIRGNGELDPKGSGTIRGIGTDMTTLSGKRKIEVGDGNYYVRVTNESGCIQTFTYEFHKPGGCDHYFKSSTIDGYDGRVIRYCVEVRGMCGSFNGETPLCCDDYTFAEIIFDVVNPFFSGLFNNDASNIVIDNLHYFPCDPLDPCNSGGLLKCNGCGSASDDIIRQVPENIGGQLITLGNDKCGCLFPPTSVAGFDGDLAVFGELSDCVNPAPATEFSCDGNNLPPPPYECPPECDHCEVEFDEEGCTYDVLCINDAGGSDPVLEDVPNFSICRKDRDFAFGNSQQVEIYQACNNDDCNVYYLGSISYDYNDEESMFISALNGIGVNVEEDIDCLSDGEAECSIDDIPLCECSQINPLIGNGGNNSTTTMSQTDYSSLSAQKENIEKVFSTRVYPNPFNNKITVDITLPLNSEINVQVFDGIGKEIRTRKLKGHEGQNRIIMYLSDEITTESGLFFISIYDENGNTAVQKVLKATN